MTLTREERYERQKIYKSKPSAIERRREYDKLRLQDPEVVARMKAYRQSDRGKEVIKRASAKLRSTEEYKEKARLYKRSEKYQRWRRSDLIKKKYGITLDVYEKMLLDQKGVCAICGEKESFTMRGTTHSLAIDHSHDTLKVRGLLCRYCNQMLGSAKDKIQTLKNAVKYLEKYG